MVSYGSHSSLVTEVLRIPTSEREAVNRAVRQDIPHGGEISCWFVVFVFKTAHVSLGSPGAPP
jgi:hypothetical protein